jgi:hypothetical protein
MTNCLPSATDNSGGSGGGDTSNGGNSGSDSSSNASGGNTSGGGTTYASSSTHASGGTTYASSSSTHASGGTTYASSSTQSNGGTTYASTTSSPPTGGSTTTPTTTTPTGGTPPVGGSPGGPPTGTTVTFAAGKATGAMTGYGWVALGSADSITDPTCGGKPITSAAPCATSTTWASATALCISGTIPALGTPPDYTGNWGVSVGVNSDAAGGGLAQSFSSITIAVTGSPSSGLRAMVHKKGEPDATSYCAALTSGPMPLTSFSTTCYNTATPGIAITAADVPNIDKVSVQVSSGSAAITVASLCITGITFAK